MRLINALMILIIILLFFQLAPVLIWILKLLLALGFISLAYDEYKHDHIGWTIFYGILALVFQPLVPLGLGQAILTVIKILVLLWLVKLIFGKEENF